MPSRRTLIRMSPEEERAYLAACSRVIVTTNGPDGMPHPVPMNYGLDPGGRIVITAFRKSQKIRNLERDPRATLLVESGETYAELKAVMAWCDAEIVTDPDRVRALMGHVRAEAALATSLTGGMNEQVRASLAKRAVVLFTPYKTVSWDHAKLGAHY
jgi:nitroimidazol reductase NimA-like FMN-containing flavoprotein (pyridoxamine 5'-phosphate oxidase superfamily)